jgi:hypothetical protein
MVYITHVRLSSGGSAHEHITSVQWRNSNDGKSGSSTKAEMVTWIRDKSGDARVRDARGNDVSVGVVDANPPYIRTYADGIWTDNLLALPRF